MNRTGNTEAGGRKLSTADLAAAARQPDAARKSEERHERERVEPDLDARSREDRRLDERGSDAARDDNMLDRDARLRESRADDVDSRDLRERDVRAAESAVRDAEGAVMPTPAQTAQKAIPSASAAPVANAMPAPAPSEKLDPLFAPEMARDFRARWTAVQSSFVDDPRKAAKQGDELVAQVMSSLAESFAAERDKLEGQLGQMGEASTEILRVSLRRYRSFFERLLSL